MEALEEPLARHRVLVRSGHFRDHEQLLDADRVRDRRSNAVHIRLIRTHTQQYLTAHIYARSLNGTNKC